MLGKLTYFFKLKFFKKFFPEHLIRMSNSLDPDQDRRSGSKLFEKVVSRRQMSLQARK